MNNEKYMKNVIDVEQKLLSTIDITRRIIRVKNVCIEDSIKLIEEIKIISSNIKKAGKGDVKILKNKLQGKIDLLKRLNNVMLRL